MLAGSDDFHGSRGGKRTTTTLRGGTQDNVTRTPRHTLMRRKRKRVNGEGPIVATAKAVAAPIAVRWPTAAAARLQLYGGGTIKYADAYCGQNRPRLPPNRAQKIDFIGGNDFLIFYESQNLDVEVIGSSELLSSFFPDRA